MLDTQKPECTLNVRGAVIAQTLAIRRISERLGRKEPESLSPVRGICRSF